MGLNHKKVKGKVLSEKEAGDFFVQFGEDLAIVVAGKIATNQNLVKVQEVFFVAPE